VKLWERALFIIITLVNVNLSCMMCVVKEVPVQMCDDFYCENAVFEQVGWFGVRS